MDKEKGGRGRNPGVIISAFERASRFIYKKADESMICGVMTAYDRENEAADASLTSGVRHGIGVSRRILKPLKRRIASSVETSAIFGFIRSKLDSLLSCSMRVWGIFVLSFALYTALAYLIRGFSSGDAELMNLYTAAAMALLSLPMLASSRTLAAVVYGSRMVSFLLFGIMGVSRAPFERERKPVGKSNVAFIFGMIFGIATYAVSPVLVLLGLVLLVASYMVLISPELGLVAVIFISPFSEHSMPLALAVVFIMLCYIVKLVLGKRTIRFELCDGAVLLFMIIMALGGVFSVSPGATLKPAFLMVCLMMGYFLAVNLLRTREWVMRGIGALVTSSFVVAAYGLYENFFGTLETTWQDKEMFGEIEGRVVSTFGNPNVLAEFLIMTIPFAAALFLAYRGAGSKLVFFAISATGAGCLIYTWSRGAWLGFMLGALLFIILYSYRSMIVIFFGLAALPFLPFVLPESIMTRFTSIGSVADSSTSYRVHIWEACIKMARDFWVGGIGVGEAAFGQVYPKYTLAGIETAPHSHNLFLQILIETGAAGLLAFLCVIFLFAQSCIGFVKRKSDYPEPRSLSPMKVIVLAGMCGIFAILAQGMTDYVWYNYRVFFIFWLTLGLTLAARRSSLEALILPTPGPNTLDLVIDFGTDGVRKRKIKFGGKAK